MLKITSEPWTCRWDYQDAPRRFLSVPAGTVYDGASVPRPVWSLAGIRPDGLIRAASLAHDCLYRSKGNRLSAVIGPTLTNANGNRLTVDRAEADWVLREFMAFAGMSRLRCRRAWLAVRSFGWLYWGKDSPTMKALNRKK